ncbi:MAG: DUF1833 family protein [Smithella sp.]
MAISAATLAELYSQQTSGALIELLSIEADGYDTQYITNNTIDLTYNSQLYTAIPFVLTPHTEQNNSIGTGSLTIANMEALITVLRSYQGIITITLQAVFYKDGSFDPVKGMSYIVSDIDCDSQAIQATLKVDDCLDDEMLYLELTPNVAPGLFI